MELLTPGIGLMIWQTIVFVNIVLLIYSGVLILKSTFELKTKVLMMFISTIIPLLGSIFCIILLRRHNRRFNGVRDR
jgi:hypothetical protein